MKEFSRVRKFRLRQPRNLSGKFSPNSSKYLWKGQMHFLTSFSFRLLEEETKLSGRRTGNVKFVAYSCSNNSQEIRPKTKDLNEKYNNKVKYAYLSKLRGRLPTKYLCFKLVPKKNFARFLWRYKPTSTKHRLRPPKSRTWMKVW